MEGRGGQTNRHDLVILGNFLRGLLLAPLAVLISSDPRPSIFLLPVWQYLAEILVSNVRLELPVNLFQVADEKNCYA